MLFVAAIAEKCPKKLYGIATENVKTYLKGFYKKVGNIKMKCDYDHDSNIFNISHHVKAEATYKERKLNFEFKTHSSMFDLYNFSDFDGKVCHAHFDDIKKSKDLKLIKKAFVNKYIDGVKSKDIKRSEREGQVCYKAKVTKKKRTKKSLI